MSQINRLSFDVHIVLCFELDSSDLLLVSSKNFLYSKSESGAYFLHINSFVPLLEYVPMVPKKYEISLIMKCYYSSSPELWLLREERSQ